MIERRPFCWTWGLIIAFLLLNATSACSAEIEIPTFMPTSTQAVAPTQTRVPAASPTWVSPPTRTSTPGPPWVTDFANPILDLLSNRVPNFEDSFDIPSRVAVGPDGPPCPLPDDMAPRVWVRSHYCGPTRAYVENGKLLLEDCDVTRSDIYFRDYAVEFDARVEGFSSGARWGIVFRSYCQFSVDGGGNALVECGQFKYSDKGVNSGRANTHVLFIAKGPRFAVYLNNKPFLYFEDSTFPGGSFCLRGGSKSIFDNFKIWNITSDSLP